MEVALAIFPVRHTGTRFQRMVRITHGDKWLFDNGCRFGKAGVEVAESPFVGELGTGGFATGAQSVDSRLWPFDRFDLGTNNRGAFRAFFLRTH